MPARRICAITPSQGAIGKVKAGKGCSVDSHATSPSRKVDDSGPSGEGSPYTAAAAQMSGDAHASVFRTDLFEGAVAIVTCVN